jgi:hypothetical protein
MGLPLIPLHSSSPACEAPIVFRYDFGSGGYGDCIKGLVAVAQLASVLDCPFVADFSRHPFGKYLPFISDVVAVPVELAAVSEGDARFVNMGDWTTGPHRLAARDAFFAAMAPPATALRKSGAVIIANIPHHRELALAHSGVLEESLVSLARLLYASFYSLVLNGAELGHFWPPTEPSAARPFRVGFHLRMGDMFIAAARDGPTKGDNRNRDIGDLSVALSLAASQARALAAGQPMVFFACADTMEAREVIRAALSPTPVISSLMEPAHIGFRESFGHPEEDATKTISVAREHHTLSTADAIFIASNSGFSKTACAIAGAKSPSTVHCFFREGTAWTPLAPGQGVWD